VQVSAKISPYKFEILLLFWTTNYGVNFLIEESGVSKTGLHVRDTGLPHKYFPSYRAARKAAVKTAPKKANGSGISRAGYRVGW
jgi:hypothetical protein